MVYRPVETISVIMPCYNAAEHIAASVSSVLGQTFANIQLVVVNDGSTDNSLHILKKIKDNRLEVINQPNSGVCVARNRGLSAAIGAYVAFLDADDTWRPDCLEKLYAALQNKPNVILAYCGWQNIGLPGGQGEPFVPPDYEGPDKVETLLRVCLWPIHATLTKREAIEDAGGFDERFKTSEDYGLWLRIATFNKITRVAEVLAFYNHHDGTQATKNRELVARNHWLVQREFLHEHHEIARQLGRKRVRELTHGELLKQGYICYWDRNLEAAHAIFRMVMKTGYGTLKDWKYMMPTLLPFHLYIALIKLFDRKKGTV